MVIRQGNYAAELFPRIANAPPEENVYRIVISETRGEATGADFIFEEYEQGLEAAKKRAELLLQTINNDIREQP